MTSRVFLFFLGLTIIGIQACGDDSAEPTTGELALNFTATYSDQPLVLLGETYTYPGGVPINVQVMNYFISDVTLLKSLSSDEGAELLSEIELVSYEDTYDEASALAGITFNYDELPLGEYAGIRLGLGVAPRLNATQPGDYSPGHPLANNYWSPAKDYIFTKLEGSADVEGNGEFGEGLTYHTGADELYVELSFAKPITIDANTPAMVTFEMDVAKVLTAKDGTYLNINDSNFRIDHNVRPEVYEFLWANWQSALSVK